ncbi:hypothetical protein PTSG_08876 [Salpingoeca rosetta]|uniref:EGF-like domain-containing protein n=1 Tax=Salpingoeca rosetta (strain ATCC 50818 / BSB-021) TaxID=946362 RepID=F2UKY7_SALR5|nr:uncharacterized protein PTSG_08876 [Salpingoeca rosetta]EGD77786.1 hypothetical protein PTSG_08876 [Salpingoeca rosetta]|eukprot:XP_004990262.1 hypothetical protein PTSG_08876 [Salpingoeca rosetta]
MMMTRNKHLVAAGGAVAVAVLLMAMMACADYPPAPNSGGAKCSINAECGIPAANCQSLRDKCASLTGSCKNSTCVCAANMYGCPNCHAKAVLDRDPDDPTQFRYSTKLPMYDGSGRYIDVCSVPHGGSKCKADEDCGGMGGLCLDQHCVCPDGYLCGDCRLMLNDFLYGLNCTFPSGGGSCKTDADCHDGTCLHAAGQRAFCQCNPLFACKHCTASVLDLVHGRATCH